MIKAFTITNYLGDSITLEMGRPAQTGFLIRKVSGLGPVKANINAVEISTSDGALFNSARLNKRNIVFDLVFVESVLKESIEDIRQKSYKYFPIKRDISIVIETDNRIVRTSGYVESNEPDIFSEQENAQISVICPDPFFYSAGEDGTMETVFYGIEPEFEFPFSNESLTEPLLIFGSMQIKTENVIVYPGDAEIGITIRIHALGNVKNLTIYNSGTREIMKIDTDKLEAMTGNGIIAGDDIIICTLKGDKGITLVRDGVSSNILNSLAKDTDWFTLAEGDNIFAFGADEGTANLQFFIENNVIYEGV